METTIKAFYAPEVKVRISNLMVNSYQKQFSCTIETKEKGKRKWTKDEVSGGISADTADYFSKLKDHKIKVKADNEEGFSFIQRGLKMTDFQRFLEKQGLDPLTMLNTLVFECDNNSESYQDNPFRIVSYLDGHATLCLINTEPKRLVQRIDTTTGEVSTMYYHKTFKDKDGNVRRSFKMPKSYRRLVIQQEKQVEVIQ